MVHGEENCASILVNICEGAGPFDRFYEESIIPNVNGVGVSTKKYSKALYSPTRNTVILADSEHLQVKWLRMKSLKDDCTYLITERTFSHHATSAIKEGKRALAIATKFLPADGNLPYGVTGEDIMKNVLSGMRRKDYCTKHKIDPLAELVAPIPHRPTKRVFSGNLAYAYFGCPILVSHDRRLGVFTEGGKTLGKKANMGRKYKRTTKNWKEENKQQPLKRKDLASKGEVHSSLLRQQHISSLQLETCTN